jgi:hypothetical protein
MNASYIIDAAWLKEFDLEFIGVPTKGLSVFR